MSSPFLNRTGGSGTSKIIINGVSVDALGFLSLPLSYLPDVEIVTESLATGELLSYDATSGKWSNIAQTPSTYPFSLFQPLSQKGVEYCGLDANTLVPINNIPSIGVSKISDFSISNPSNDQILVYTTASSLNKWTPYTITGATFNDTDKAITISAGSSALSSLTDVTITNVGDGNLLMYSTGSAKWLNIDAIPDNILFLKDNNVDGTKKLQFQLSSITTGQTRTLTIPDASCVIVGDTNVQTLTNKSLNDTTTTLQNTSDNTKKYNFHYHQ